MIDDTINTFLDNLFYIMDSWLLNVEIDKNTR